MLQPVKSVSISKTQDVQDKISLIKKNLLSSYAELFLALFYLNPTAGSFSRRLSAHKVG